MTTPTIKPGIYTHYKHPDQQYRVHHLVMHTETEEWMVLYESLYDNPKSKFWVRPLSMFIEQVDAPNYNYSGPRFTFIQP